VHARVSVVFFPIAHFVRTDFADSSATVVDFFAHCLTLYDVFNTHRRVHLLPINSGSFSVDKLDVNTHIYILITIRVSKMTKVTSQALHKKNIEIKEKKKKINESSDDA